MRLGDIARAINSLDAGQAKPTTHAFMIYGPPKAGKTELVATIARMPEYDVIYWFDIENGSATLLRMYKDGKLTLEQLDKIILIKIPDTREDPVAIETLLKSFATRQAVTICEEHGKVFCTDCKKASKPAINFDYRSLTKRSAVVVDSLSQAGTSSLNMACRGRASEYKPGFDEYGASNKWLSDLCTVFQAAQYCDIYCITHVAILEDENKNDIYMPMCGSKNFSAMVAKFFGTVIFVNKKLKKHRAESSTLTSMNTQSGSRLGIELEKLDTLDLGDALRNAGFVGGGAPKEEAASTEPAATPAPAVVKQSRFGQK